MAGYIEDRWVNKRVSKKTGKRERTERYGKGKRYKVDGIPGVKPAFFDNLKDAEKWKAKAITKIGEGTWIDPRAGDVTLREYVEKTWWPSLRVPPTTKESMKSRVFNHILPHAGSLPLNRIGDEEIRAWVVRAEQDLDVSSIRVAWRHFSQIMQAATTGKRIPANPFREPDLKAPSVPKSKAKAWPRETVAAVREGIGARYRILVDEAVGGGLRQGETFGLSLDDIDGDVIHVVRQVIKVGGKLAFAPPKGNKERDAPCPARLAAAIDAHAAEFPSVNVTLPWVDPARPNLPWDERPLRTVRLLVTTTHTDCAGGGAVNRTTFDEAHWKPALVRAGVISEPKVEYVQAKGKKPWRKVVWDMDREDGFHVLRHTFSSVVLQSGETIQKLAAWLGHSDPAFTYRTYAHFLPDSGNRAMATLGDWVGAAPDVLATGGGEDAIGERVALLAVLAEILENEREPEQLRSRLSALLSPVS